MAHSSGTAASDVELTLLKHIILPHACQHLLQGAGLRLVHGMAKLGAATGQGAGNFACCIPCQDATSSPQHGPPLPGLHGVQLHVQHPQLASTLSTLVVRPRGPLAQLFGDPDRVHMLRGTDQDAGQMAAQQVHPPAAWLQERDLPTHCWTTAWPGRPSGKQKTQRVLAGPIQAGEACCTLYSSQAPGVLLVYWSQFIDTAVAVRAAPADRHQVQTSGPSQRLKLGGWMAVRLHGGLAHAAVLHPRKPRISRDDGVQDQLQTSLSTGAQREGLSVDRGEAGNSSAQQEGARLPLISSACVAVDVPGSAVALALSDNHGHLCVLVLNQQQQVIMHRLLPPSPSDTSPQHSTRSVHSIACLLGTGLVCVMDSHGIISMVDMAGRILRIQLNLQGASIPVTSLSGGLAFPQLVAEHSKQEQHRQRSRSKAAGADFSLCVLRTTAARSSYQHRSPRRRGSPAGNGITAGVGDTLLLACTDGLQLVMLQCSVPVALQHVYWQLAPCAAAGFQHQPTKQAIKPSSLSKRNSDQYTPFKQHQQSGDLKLEAHSSLVDASAGSLGSRSKSIVTNRRAASPNRDGWDAQSPRPRSPLSTPTRHAAQTHMHSQPASDQPNEQKPQLHIVVPGLDHQDDPGPQSVFAQTTMSGHLDPQPSQPPLPHVQLAAAAMAHSLPSLPAGSSLHKLRAATAIPIPSINASDATRDAQDKADTAGDAQQAWFAKLAGNIHWQAIGEPSAGQQPLGSTSKPSQSGLQATASQQALDCTLRSEVISALLQGDEAFLHGELPASLAAYLSAGLYGVLPTFLVLLRMSCPDASLQLLHALAAFLAEHARPASSTHPHANHGKAGSHSFAGASVDAPSKVEQSGDQDAACRTPQQPTDAASCDAERQQGGYEQPCPAGLHHQWYTIATSTLSQHLHSPAVQACSNQAVAEDNSQILHAAWLQLNLGCQCMAYVSTSIRQLIKEGERAAARQAKATRAASRRSSLGSGVLSGSLHSSIPGNSARNAWSSQPTLSMHISLPLPCIWHPLSPPEDKPSQVQETARTLEGQACRFQLCHAAFDVSTLLGPQWVSSVLKLGRSSSLRQTTSGGGTLQLSGRMPMRLSRSGALTAPPNSLAQMHASLRQLPISSFLEQLQQPTLAAGLLLLAHAAHMQQCRLSQHAHHTGPCLQWDLLAGGSACWAGALWHSHNQWRKAAVLALCTQHCLDTPCRASCANTGGTSDRSDASAKAASDKSCLELGKAVLLQQLELSLTAKEIGSACQAMEDLAAIPRDLLGISSHLHLNLVKKVIDTAMPILPKRLCVTALLPASGTHAAGLLQLSYHSILTQLQAHLGKAWAQAFTELYVVHGCQDATAITPADLGLRTLLQDVEAEACTKLLLTWQGNHQAVASLQDAVEEACTFAEDFELCGPQDWQISSFAGLMDAALASAQLLTPADRQAALQQMAYNVQLLLSTRLPQDDSRQDSPGSKPAWCQADSNSPIQARPRFHSGSGTSPSPFGPATGMDGQNQGRRGRGGHARSPSAGSGSGGGARGGYKTRVASWLPPVKELHQHPQQAPPAPSLYGYNGRPTSLPYALVPSDPQMPSCSPLQQSWTCLATGHSPMDSASRQAAAAAGTQPAATAHQSSSFQALDDSQLLDVNDLAMLVDAMQLMQTVLRCAQPHMGPVVSGLLSEPGPPDTGLPAETATGMTPASNGHSVNRSNGSEPVPSNGSGPVPSYGSGTSPGNVHAAVPGNGSGAIPSHGIEFEDTALMRTNTGMLTARSVSEGPTMYTAHSDVIAAEDVDDMMTSMPSQSSGMALAVLPSELSLQGEAGVSQTQQGQLRQLLPLEAAEAQPWTQPPQQQSRAMEQGGGEGVGKDQGRELMGTGEDGNPAGQDGDGELAIKQLQACVDSALQSLLDYDWVLVCRAHVASLLAWLQAQQQPTRAALAPLSTKDASSTNDGSNGASLCQEGCVATTSLVASAEEAILYWLAALLNSTHIHADSEMQAAVHTVMRAVQGPAVSSAAIEALASALQARGILNSRIAGELRRLRVAASQCADSTGKGPGQEQGGYQHVPWPTDSLDLSHELSVPCPDQCRDEMESQIMTVLAAYAGLGENRASTSLSIPPNAYEERSSGSGSALLCSLHMLQQSVAMAQDTDAALADRSINTGDRPSSTMASNAAISLLPECFIVPLPGWTRHPLKHMNGAGQRVFGGRADAGSKNGLAEGSAMDVLAALLDARCWADMIQDAPDSTCPDPTDTCVEAAVPSSHAIAGQQQHAVALHTAHAAIVSTAATAAHDVQTAAKPGTVSNTSGHEVTSSDHTNGGSWVHTEPISSSVPPPANPMMVAVAAQPSRTQAAMLEVGASVVAAIPVSARTGTASPETALAGHAGPATPSLRPSGDPDITAETILPSSSLHSQTATPQGTSPHPLPLCASSTKQAEALPKPTTSAVSAPLTPFLASTPQAGLSIRTNTANHSAKLQLGREGHSLGMPSKSCSEQGSADLSDFLRSPAHASSASSPMALDTLHGDSIDSMLSGLSALPEGSFHTYAVAADSITQKSSTVHGKLPAAAGRLGHEPALDGLNPAGTQPLSQGSCISVITVSQGVSAVRNSIGAAAAARQRSQQSLPSPPQSAQQLNVNGQGTSQRSLHAAAAAAAGIPQQAADDDEDNEDDEGSVSSSASIWYTNALADVDDSPNHSGAGPSSGLGSLAMHRQQAAVNQGGLKSVRRTNRHALDKQAEQDHSTSTVPAPFMQLPAPSATGRGSSIAVDVGTDVDGRPASRNSVPMSQPRSPSWQAVATSPHASGVMWGIGGPLHSPVVAAIPPTSSSRASPVVPKSPRGTHTNAPPNPAVYMYLPSQGNQDASAPSSVTGMGTARVQPGGTSALPSSQQQWPVATEQKPFDVLMADLRQNRAPTLMEAGMGRASWEHENWPVQASHMPASRAGPITSPPKLELRYKAQLSLSPQGLLQNHHRDSANSGPNTLTLAQQLPAVIPQSAPDSAGTRPQATSWAPYAAGAVPGLGTATSYSPHRHRAPASANSSRQMAVHRYPHHLVQPAVGAHLAQPAVRTGNTALYDNGFMSHRTYGSTGAGAHTSWYGSPTRFMGTQMHQPQVHNPPASAPWPAPQHAVPSPNQYRYYRTGTGPATSEIIRNPLYENWQRG